jgi:hypothetical protein
VQPEALDLCPWLCAAPTGPSTPFAWPALLVVDTFRLLIAAAAAVLVVVSVWAIRCSITQGQKCRFAFAALLALASLGTELDRIGDWPHWRFVVNLTGVALGLWGYYQHFRHELPASDRPERNKRSP